MVSVTRNGVAIAELREVILPELAREFLETTRLADDDDVVKVSIRQAGTLEFTINLVTSDPEHLALLDAWENTTTDDYAVTTADGAEWAFLALVLSILLETEGALIARIEVQPTGGISFGPFLLTEADEPLLTEDDARIMV